MAVVGTGLVGGLVVMTMTTGGGFTELIGVADVAVPIRVGTVWVGETGVGELAAPGSKTKKGGKEIFPLGVRYVPAHDIGVRICGSSGWKMENGR